MSSIDDPTKIDLAAMYVLNDVEIDHFYRLLGPLQAFRAEYLQSYVLLERNTFNGLDAFRSTKRIGDKSMYGIVRLRPGKRGFRAQGRFILLQHDIGERGYHHMNQLRMVAPYWVYTYTAVRCNTNLEIPGGTSTHVWCNYATQDLQVLLEKVEGVSYSAFLQTVKDPNRQMAVLARIIDAVTYMWVNHITHGDLHGLNVKVVTFDSPMYTRILCPQDKSVKDYIVGMDIPVLLDYGFSSVTRVDGVLLNEVAGVDPNNNPNHDMDKILHWVKAKGHVYSGSIKYNSLGMFYHSLKTSLSSLNTARTLVPHSAPVLHQTVPAEVYATSYRDGSLLYDNSSTTVQDSFFESMVFKRRSFTSPQQLVNMREVLPHLPASIQNSTLRLFEAFDMASYMISLETFATKLRAERDNVFSTSTLLNSGNVDTPKKKKEMYQLMSSRLFGYLDNMFDLINDIHYSKLWLCGLPTGQGAREEAALERILGIWTKEELHMFLDFLLHTAKSWQGLNYMANKPKEYFSAAQRKTVVDAIGILYQNAIVLTESCPMTSTPNLTSPKLLDSQSDVGYFSLNQQKV